MDLRSAIGPDGKIHVSQGVIVGCSGGMYGNVSEAADVLASGNIGNGGFELSVYPASAPVGLALTKDGVTAALAEAGAVVKPAFCGPCFGAGDTPGNNTLSIRPATRNFANREGAKPGNGQCAAVALMDARSIAATAANGGVLTAASDVDYTVTPREYHYDGGIYDKRCWFGYGHPLPETPLRFGPNITDWPEIPAMKRDLLVRLCAVIRDPVTTTDELIPSGETSSYRSNPLALAEFTLSRRVPEYVAKSKAVRDGAPEAAEALQNALAALGADPAQTGVATCIFANKPGDGSAREQAASCQRVLGGGANVALEYATKRYRSNCLNWGIVPFTASAEDTADLAPEDWIYIPGLRQGILEGKEEFAARVLRDGQTREIRLRCGGLSVQEREILAAGCLMNWYKTKGEH